jgi:hypothetical protein
MKNFKAREQRRSTDSRRTRGHDSRVSNEHPDSTFRLWVDPETGLMLKAQLVSKKLNATIPYLF